MKGSLLFLLLFLVQIGQAQLFKKNLKVYSSKLKVSYQIRHEGNDSYLYVKTAANEVRIAFQTYRKYDGRDMLYNYERDFKGKPSNIYKIKIESKAPMYVLYLRVTNLDTRSYFSDLVQVNRLQENNQSIYLVNTTDDSPILNNYLSLEQEFKLEHRHDSIRHFYVKYFSAVQAAAHRPDGRPSKVFNPLKNFDEMYIIPRGKGLLLTEPGIYFVQTDSNSNKGIFLNCFANNFPAANSVDELITSLRYLTKQEEYEALLNAEDRKKELDRYWLGRRQSNTRDPKKAKSLIAIYYNRIQNANLKFTTFKEGWKTDRGMIYVVFGKPDIVRKYAAQEVWYYSSSRDRYPVELIFDRIGEQYLLKRSETLRRPWRAEINSWRKGAVNF